MRGLRAMVVITVLGCSARPGDAADIVLGSDASDKVKVQINKKSANPLKHKIQYSAKDTAILLGSTDDPVTNGATAMVFSATDCQCIVMGPAPGTTPGWTLNGSSTTYKWKDDTTKSSAQVKDGKIKFKRKGGIAYGLDFGTPQGEVEVQITFGTSADRFCTRFAAPTRPIHDAATLYTSTVFDTGTASCSAVPGFCGPCVQPIPCSPACDGTCVGGVCWFLGAPGASCDATCAAVGKTCDLATTTYAGSGGTTSNCAAVLNALLPAGGAVDTDCTGFGPLGCSYISPADEYLRCTTPPTTCAASYFPVQRACACQ